MTAAPAPRSWRRLAFAGLSIAVPSSWPVTKTSSAYECALECVIALPSPPQVVLDTDTAPGDPLCAGISPGVAVDGLVVHAGTTRAPNVVRPGSPGLHLNGLRAFVNQVNPFFILTVEVEVPGRHMPVEVLIGLGDVTTAARVLRSIASS